MGSGSQVGVHLKPLPRLLGGNSDNFSASRTDSMKWSIFGNGGSLLEISDVSVTGILDSLTAMAWSTPCREPDGSFLLSPEGLARACTAEDLERALRRMYEHARNWAPGLDIPWFVPPVRIVALDSHAGHFLVDEESYASITVSRAFLNSIEAALLILAHEACHHILLQTGISYRYKNDVALNEKITDMTMFVCGFGELVRRGQSVVHHSHGQFVSTHLGYWCQADYERAHRYVLARRAAAHLPGLPHPSSFWISLRKKFNGLLTRSGPSKPPGTLLDKVIHETERQRRRSD